MLNGNVALILAAGASTRMGTCKANLPWVEGTTLLTYQVNQWLLAGVSPIVVLGPHNAQLQHSLPPDTQVAINPAPSVGKTSSILIGLEKISVAWKVLAIAAVDQPRPTWIYQTLLREHFQQSKPITAPIYQTRLGHPLLFASEMLPHLKAIQEESLGLRQLITAFKLSINAVEVDAPIVLVDLNTPEIYQRTLHSFCNTCDSNSNLKAHP